jgi:hypothetical protein
MDVFSFLLDLDSNVGPVVLSLEDKLKILRIRLAGAREENAAFNEL